jgi:hypothetical protein
MKRERRGSEVKKILVTLALTAAIVGVIPVATASAGPYFSATEAARVMGSIVHKEWAGVVPGSGQFTCYKRSHSVRFCQSQYYVRGQGAGCWWTDAIIRKTWSGYRYRITYDVKCH